MQAVALLLGVEQTWPAIKKNILVSWEALNKRLHNVQLVNITDDVI
jgi:hypothetical protein